MIKLALIGKNIAHSRSPEIYRKLTGQALHYDLLDFPSPDLIPGASELLLTYQGFSITSPYKKHFLNEIKLTKNAELLGAINCVGKRNNEIIGENTDFLAIIDILKNLEAQYGKLKIIILGDGVMSLVTQVALQQLNIEFIVCSRKSTQQFDQLNCINLFTHMSGPHQKCVINTCAREFIFQGQIDKETLFWDYNYQFLPHESALSLKVKRYMDGLEMLELQARHALAFWSI